MHANEDLLLMYSARIELEGEMIEAFDSLLHTKLDWDYLWLTACQHRIASLVFHHIKKAGSHALVPAEIIKKLEANYNAMAYQNLLIRNELVSILKAFEEKNIGVLLLKGWALIGTVYKNLALRPMSDIDLLVRKGAIPEVRVCMASLGFSQNLKLEGIPAIDDHHLTFYASDGQSAPIEVHWNIGMDVGLFPIDSEAMIKRASMIHFEGVKAGILSPEDSLQKWTPLTGQER